MKPLYFSRVHTRCERYSLTKRLSMNRYSLSILCAAVVAVVTTLFIEHTRVVNIRRQFASESVRSDWNTARFVIRAYHNNMDWFLRRIYLELSPKLRQPVKTHFSLNGELSYGNVSTEVHEGV